jgi:hypothetical protein
MSTHSILTRADYEDYLVYLYFGAPADYLTGCVDRAYRDFSRTLRGLRIIETKAALYDQAQQTLIQHLELLREPHTQPTNAEVFDSWHRGVCSRLVMLYREHAHAMYIGQAQKWVNMALKYIFTVGEERVPGFQAVYPFCHIPIDSILMQQFQPYHPPSLPDRWSRIDDYNQYLMYQHWIRQQFSRLPLDIEFLLWLKKVPPK